MRVLGLLTVTLLALAGCATTPGGGGPTSAPPASATPGPDDPVTSPPDGATRPAPTPSPTVAGAPVAADLRIEVDPTGEGAVTTATLTCVPAGGDHPDPAAACAQLATGGAEALEPPPTDAACTDLYGGPARATVTGTVAGEPVRAALSRSDGCEIARWDALDVVLGSSGAL